MSVILPLASTPVDELGPLLWPAVTQTLQMTGATVLIEMLLGIPLGALLFNTSPSGLFPRRAVHQVLSVTVNVFRSLPFLILMALLLPLTSILVGTMIGVRAAVVPMAFAAVPYYARLVETALREVSPEVIEVARASAATPLQAIRRVQLHEAVPGLVTATTVAIVGAIGLSTVAGTMGGGGIGYLALAYGYQRFDTTMMIATAIILVAFVQLVQLTGDLIFRKVSRR